MRQFSEPISVFSAPSSQVFSSRTLRLQAQSRNCLGCCVRTALLLVELFHETEQTTAPPTILLSSPGFPPDTISTPPCPPIGSSVRTSTAFLPPSPFPVRQPRGSYIVHTMLSLKVATPENKYIRSQRCHPMQETPSHNRFLVSIQLALHATRPTPHVSLRAWCEPCLPGR